MLWSSLAYLAGPAAQLLAAPYLIRHLGSEVYGILLLVNSVIQVSGLSSFGLGDATVKYVAEYAAQKRRQDLVALLQTTLLLYIFLGGLTVVGLNLLAPLLAERLFKVSPEFEHAAVLGLRIGSVSLLLSLVYSVGQSLCRGLRRHDVESSTAAFGSLVAPLCSCWLVSRGQGLVTVISVTCVIMFLNNVVLAWRCSRLVGTAAWLLPKFQWDNVRRLASYGFFGWIQMLEFALVNQGDRLVISAVLGPAAVTPYFLCAQLTQMASGIVSQAFSYLFPMATQLIVEKRDTDLKRLFLTGMQSTSIASLSVAALMFTYGQTILFVWVGNSLGNYDRNLILVMASSTALMGTTIVPFYVLNGAGYVRLNALFIMMSGAAVFPTSLWLVHRLGLIGMAISKMANIVPGLVARVIIGRIILNDRRILICIWHLVPTVGGLLVLWGVNLSWHVPEHVVGRPWAAMASVFGAIATTTMLTFLVYGPEIRRLNRGSAPAGAVLVPDVMAASKGRA